MFAGPNGSGKSTLKKLLPDEYLGHYLNPDELEQRLAAGRAVDFGQYGLQVDPEKLTEYLRSHSVLQSPRFARSVEQLQVVGNCIDLAGVSVNSYIASALIAFIRQQLLVTRQTFTFETVMSHPSKVDFLRAAKSAGFRTYLYYIATEDPEINLSRVESRVAAGGHDVPHRKVSERYYRSLDLLLEAIRQSNRAYIFDNSTESADHVWIAEITEGREMEVKSPIVPAWFHQYVMLKIT